MFGLHFPEDIKSITTMINYCCCLIASGKWRQIIWYRKINITSFIFRSKDYQATGDSFHLEIFCLGWNIYWNYLYVKGIVSTLMLTFNLWLLERAEICALICRNLSCHQNFLYTCLGITITWLWPSFTICFLIIKTFGI